MFKKLFIILIIVGFYFSGIKVADAKNIATDTDKKAPTSHEHDITQTMQVSVNDFGAKGDGKTDSSEAIQKAIDKLGPAGGIVFFPPGKYLCSNLHLKNSVQLIGAGLKATKLVPKDSIPVIIIDGAHKIVIKDLSIEHDRSFPANGILFSEKDGARWFTIQNVWIYGLRGYALKTTKYIWESLIENCQFRMCGDQETKTPVVFIVQESGEREGANNLIFRNVEIAFPHWLAISMKSDVNNPRMPGVRVMKFLDCFFHGGTSEHAPLKPAPANLVEIDNFSDLYFDRCNFAWVAPGFYALRLDSSVASKSLRARITNCRFVGPPRAMGIYIGRAEDTFIFANNFDMSTGPHIIISSQASKTHILPQAQSFNSLKIDNKGAGTILMTGNEMMNEIINKNIRPALPNQRVIE